MTARVHEQKRPMDEILAELKVRGLAAEFADIARRHNVTLSEVMGPERLRPMVQARHECWRFLAGRGWSQPAIGRLFGRDASTVKYGLHNDERPSRLAKRLMRELKGAA